MLNNPEEGLREEAISSELFAVSEIRPEVSGIKEGWDLSWGFPGGASGKEPTCQCRRCRRHGFNIWVGKIPWKRKWQPTLVFLPGESHGQRTLAGYSPWGHKESDVTDHSTAHKNLNPRSSNLSTCYSLVLFCIKFG